MYTFRQQIHTNWFYYRQDNKFTLDQKLFSTSLIWSHCQSQRSTRFLSFYIDVFLPLTVPVSVDLWMFEWIKSVFVCLFVSFSLWPMEPLWNFHNSVQKCEAGQKSVDFLFWPQTIYTYKNLGMCALVKQKRNGKAEKRKRKKKMENSLYRFMDSGYGAYYRANGILM